jgi:hypothetical protein
MKEFHGEFLANYSLYGLGLGGGASAAVQGVIHNRTENVDCNRLQKYPDNISKSTSLFEHVRRGAGLIGGIWGDFSFEAAGASSTSTEARRAGGAFHGKTETLNDSDDSTRRRWNGKH